MYNAQFVVQGHADREKEMLLNNENIVCHNSVRILVTNASVHEYRIWTQDFSKSYLQGNELLSRKVYINPPAELELGPRILLRLLKSLYGLSDSGDYWYKIFSKHLREDLERNPTTGDISYFSRRENWGVMGLVASNVDDTISTGTEAFEEESIITRNKFQWSYRRENNVTFAGIKITRREHGFSVHQGNYEGKIALFPRCSGFEEFRSLRHRLAWHSHTRPDIMAPVSIFSQNTAGWDVLVKACEVYQRGLPAR